MNKTPTQNPYQVRSSRQIYKNPWLTLREDAIVLPNGEPGIYGVVETRNATGVIAFTNPDTILLVGQYRYPLGVYSWEIIEGGGNPGETPEQTIRRELTEESGYVARDVAPLGGPVHLSNCFSNETAYLFTAHGLTKTNASPDPSEVLSIRECPIFEAYRMVDSGEITDAMSIIALLRLRGVR